MERVALAEGDHVLGKRPRGLRAGERGSDALPLDEVGNQIAQGGPAMSGFASEFESCIEVSHGFSPGLQARSFLWGRRRSLAGQRRPNDLAALVELHTQAEAHLVQGLLDLIERFPADAFGAYHFVFALRRR